MRILYFSRGYSPHDYRFLSGLAGKGHQVYFLRLEENNRLQEDRLLPPAVQPVQWKKKRDGTSWLDYPAISKELRQILYEVRPDVLHAGPVQRVASLAAMTGFRPLTTMSWGSDLLKEADLNGWMRWVTRYTLQRSTVLLGDCCAVQQKAVTFGFPADRVVLFPWGVDLDHFKPADGSGLRTRLGWEGAFVLLSLRAWEPLYGVDVVVKAFIQAARQAEDLRLLLLGGGSQEEMLRKLIVQAGMTERVHFGGRVSNPKLPDFYRAADLYVSASHSDGSSVSLMEALACGKPVLASDIPGNREWITPRQEGWLFKDGDETALSAEILKAAQDRERLKRMGSSARKLAEERADWQRNLARLEYAYEKALDLAKTEKRNA
ncbi:MAG: glycosyltransferase [Anaerolineaceae bacterium]|nr:glycosyltransferase [Anaerolineaceae bacterium]